MPCPLNTDAPCDYVVTVTVQNRAPRSPFLPARSSRQKRAQLERGAVHHSSLSYALVYSTPPVSRLLVGPPAQLWASPTAWSCQLILFFRAVRGPFPPRTGAFPVSPRTAAGSASQNYAPRRGSTSATCCQLAAHSHSAAVRLQRIPVSSPGLRFLTTRLPHQAHQLRRQRDARPRTAHGTGQVPPRLGISSSRRSHARADAGGRRTGRSPRAV
ncbi:hypothetical protein FA95DRAFT_771642 [Auriscalpium vulgare]|uniref:Uncharacterized protein n=1 Tax=Auriscalpium vulgare TaxID=40419 RepID=A0ACB8RAN8_9AGAM|nr:hypothetical protein FA95DRAFT_771642 [Auriscalpium vulgare]